MPGLETFRLAQEASPVTGLLLLSSDKRKVPARQSKRATKKTLKDALDEEDLNDDEEDERRKLIRQGLLSGKDEFNKFLFI